MNAAQHANDAATSLLGHAHAVSCLLELRDGRLVTGSLDTHLRIWNLTTKSCERVIEVRDEAHINIILALVAWSLLWPHCNAQCSMQWVTCSYTRGTLALLRNKI